VPLAKLEQLERWVHEGLQPDLTCCSTSRLKLRASGWLTT